MREQLNCLLEELEFVVFDIETTGGNPEKNSITEIFALKYHHNKIVKTFHSLVNPQIPIPPIVRRMTGLTNAMLKDEPLLAAVYPGFLEFLGESVLVSHNTIGDLKFLRYFAEHICHTQLNNFYLCTHLLSEKLFPEAPNKSLSGLGAFLNLDSGKLHRAEQDTFLTLKLFNKLRERLVEQGSLKLGSAIRLQGDFESAIRLGWEVEARELTKIPNKPGVFRLYNQAKTLIFQSSSFNLAADLRNFQQWPQLPRQILRVAAQAKHIELEVTPHRFASLLKEYSTDSQHKYDHIQLGHSWHQRQVKILNFVLTPEGLKPVYGPLEENTIAAFAPISDAKQCWILIQKIAEIFELAKDKKHIFFPERHQDLIFAFFNRQIDSLLSLKKSQSGSLRNIFSPKKRRLLLKEIELAEQLQKIPMNIRCSSIQNLSGFVCSLVKKPDTWQIYPFIDGRLHSPFEYVGCLDEQGKRSIAAKIDLLNLKSPLSDKKLSSTPPILNLTKDEIGPANAALWWVFYQKEKNHADYVFLSQS
ncbi:MAG: hypothetical protein KBD78_14220 [Oligoflexales bacterium]|nr:hypothetical protein [Oligoflexales bacterium]